MCPVWQEWVADLSYTRKDMFIFVRMRRSEEQVSRENVSDDTADVIT